MNKYLDFIKGVADGTVKEPLEVYLKPELKNKRGYEKNLKILRDNLINRIELSKGNK
jgi:hypothetical protein